MDIKNVSHGMKVEICDRYKGGQTVQRIAYDTRVSYETVRKILKRNGFLPCGTKKQKLEEFLEQVNALNGTNYKPRKEV